MKVCRQPELPRWDRVDSGGENARALAIFSVLPDCLSAFIRAVADRKSRSKTIRCRSVALSRYDFAGLSAYLIRKKSNFVAL